MLLEQSDMPGRSGYNGDCVITFGINFCRDEPEDVWRKMADEYS